MGSSFFFWCDLIKYVIPFSQVLLFLELVAIWGLYLCVQVVWVQILGANLGQGSGMPLKLKVKHNGFALVHAHPDLRKDREIALASVSDRGFVLRYLEPSFKARRQGN